MATLLLADDSVTIQRVIELTFADEGIRVISVSDGEGAIARMKTDRPDVVLADVGMPNIDGYQVAAHVKETAELAHIPVLLLTGAFEPIDEARARQTGCDGVLVKPFDPRQLIRAVRAVLSGEPSPGLWPADMPRIEARDTVQTPVAPDPTPRPASGPTMPTPPPLPPLRLVQAETPQVEMLDPLSVMYDADADPDLDRALSQLEFVGVPDSAGLDAERLDLELVDDSIPEVASPEADQPTVPMPVAPPVSNPLATVFSALLAAERGEPRERSSKAAPALSEAAVEEVVVRVVKRMTDELVRKTVLETAERLIREEIDRTKSQAETPE